MSNDAKKKKKKKKTKKKKKQKKNKKKKNDHVQCIQKEILLMINQCCLALFKILEMQTLTRTQSYVCLRNMRVETTKSPLFERS